MSDLGTLPNSLIFHGPEGFGKKTLAIDLIKYLNCNTEHNSSTPETLCESCKKIESSHHPDIIVIDTTTKCLDSSHCKTKSQNSIGICVISDLIVKRAKLKPFMSNKSIVVIDEAEKLTKDSEESLLKTLEDSYIHFYIILLTNNLENIPETIISRCQTWRLNFIEKNRLSEILQTMFPEKEKEIDEILSIGEISLGKAINMINHPVMFESVKESFLRIEKIINTPLSEKLKYSKDMASLYRKDKKQVNEEIKIWKRFFRELMIIQHVGTRNYTSGVFSFITKLSTQFHNEKIQKILKIIENLEKNLSRNINPSLAFDYLMTNLEE